MNTLTPSTGASDDVVGGKYDQTVAKPVGRFAVHPAAFNWRHRCLKSTLVVSTTDADAADSAAAFVLALVLTGMMCALGGKFSNGANSSLVTIAHHPMSGAEPRASWTLLLTLALFL